ncbi:MAG TPA: M81 family metallopeptidase [Rhizomicrobium sp.]
MRLFMAMLATETNTFSPLPTGWAAFNEGGLARGIASQNPDSSLGVLLAEWRKLAGADGITVIEGTAAAAQPAGRTLRGVYEALRDDIVAEVRNALPLDIVLLNLHGAMAAEGYDDCEGDLLSRIRAVAGPTTILGAELDLHCHLTGAMLAGADVLISYKEYPHTDELARGRELYAICRDAARGLCRPVMAAFDCRMISMWRTSGEPMRGFVERMKSFEGRDGILSVSFGHGFPWGDVAEVGARLWVVTDGDKAKAERLAAQLGREIYGLRERTRPQTLGIEAALDRAAAARRGPVVLADVADNPGGGAPGDSTFILAACLSRGLRDVAIACLWDPGAVALCHEAGEGATFDLRIGGKMGPASGAPVDLRVSVRGLSDNHMQTGLSGEHVSFGRAAWVNGAGIDVVLVSRREQVFSPDAFGGMCIEPGALRILIVKSTQHFYAGFAPIASDIIYVSTPGAIAPDFTAIAYTKRDRAFWPAVADPLGLDEL